MNKVFQNILFAKKVTTKPCRSSRSQIFFKIVALKKHLCWSLFLIKLEVFSCEYGEMFKNSFFYRTPLVAASGHDQTIRIICLQFFLIKPCTYGGSHGKKRRLLQISSRLQRLFETDASLNHCWRFCFLFWLLSLLSC